MDRLTGTAGDKSINRERERSGRRNDDDGGGNDDDGEVAAAGGGGEGVRGDVDFMTVGPGFSPSSALCI